MRHLKNVSSNLEVSVAHVVICGENWINIGGGDL